MNTHDRLYHLAKEIDTRVTAIEQAASSGRAAILTWSIPAGLGTVTVDGMGSLRSVDLNPDAVETQTEASLARHILRAINEAERAARSRSDAMVKEAEKGGLW
ncbi:YbaB/EbfC family nucleoid-associated protein [Amycolatopsis roodepoortensis]|uniref:YbaB/EbfC family nucleoid-associated protein n=1 Tax=Amycolatopsis roodepoortensis TaxID=700274 RepID=UPI00214CD9D3|nr:YbaB/EbfC family nucleoid-associated protein [Amycolatopsis roodepoortensis]UUV35248.1 YbaB/EbfC family nucleoid-associated protein [Amycolatopsis roodepoortensis]